MITALVRVMRHLRRAGPFDDVSCCSMIADKMFSSVFKACQSLGDVESTSRVMTMVLGECALPFLGSGLGSVINSQ